ncbi:MAG: hypothetical protein OIF50_18235, partial [Flavobacteriaceae bacterium]|nr:hypothetical protein [Flavobacteriaceae bacterium]
AQKIIDNDYDKSDGRYYIRISDDLLESFQVNQTNTRHMEVLTEDISNESEQFPFPNPNGDANTPNPETENTALAYVITAQNDTITAKILPQALQTMENKIDAMVQKNGTLEAQSFSADNTQSILLTTGEAFTTLTFKDVLTGQQSKKFVKPLFVGKKISLYLFKGKEIIL